MTRAAGLDGAYRDFLTSSSNYEGRIMMLHDAITHGRVESFPDILAKESDDNAVCALVAGIAVHTADRAARKAFIEDKLKTGNTASRVGAALAAITISDPMDEAFAAAATEYDGDVHAALSFATAGRCTPISSELIDIAALRLSRGWRVQLPALAGAVLRAAQIAVPDAIRDAELSMLRQPPWKVDEREAIMAFYRRRPDLLVRRMHPEVARDSEIRTRLYRVAGLIGGTLMEEALEQRLDAADGVEEAGELYLECLCHGGPRSSLGQLAGLLTLHEASHEVTLPPGSLTATVLLAMRQDSSLRSRAAGALNQLGEAAEPYLRVVSHVVTDQTVGKAIGQALAQVHGATDPVVADLARLMNGEAKHLEDLELPDLALAAGSNAVRAKLAELTPAGADDAALLRYLLILASDTVDEVAIAALGGLARRRGSEPWVRELVVAQSRSTNWTLSRQAIDIMGSSGAPGFVPRLLEILKQAQAATDGDLGNRCVTALQNLADANATLGLLVIDIREPHTVNTRYGLNATVDWNADKRAESHRLLMSALDQRKNAERAAGAKGKTVLFSRPGDQSSGSVSKTVPADELESLLLYFKVTFADDETGSIVAEVGEEATGELLTALLQSEQVAVITAGWS
jgi:hypothetical protein